MRSIKERKLRINWEIKADKVMLIGQDGKQKGIVPFKDALEEAKLLGFDLVEIANKEALPICKIMDYGKYQYEKSKKMKKQKPKEVKEIKLRPGIKDYDLNIKLNQSKRFLEEGHKIKIILIFRGREILHKERGMEIMRKFGDSLRDISVIEIRPRFEDNRITMMITPIKST